ncbi:MAG TPA: hypothetical protein ENL35_12085 [Chloroflexi bacterium]|nr:hypothetical protein [Chloroflexota bacterium]
MAEDARRFQWLVLARRLRTPGLLETMSDQVPEVRAAFRDLEAQVNERMVALAQEGWRPVSHAQDIDNGILYVSVLLER